MTTDTSPKKDVIYVDIEDDITSIIDKAKAAKAPIVALVPPKRIGVLQSVVNLKLLQRAVKAVDKRVVLITNDAALSSLAAGVMIPVAKNLQSKPEVPEVTALEVDDEDVINGDELPVGDLAATAPLAGDNGLKEPQASKSAPSTTPFAATAAAKAPKKGSKLPDFDKFRKKLFFGIGGGVVMIAFLIWAFVFAPHATVAITANTNLMNIDQTLQLRPNATADTAQNILPAIVQQTKKTVSVDFDATGKKEVGEKATGQISISNSSFSAITVAAGTKLSSSSGLVFVLNANVSVPGGSFPCGNFSCPVQGSASGDVTAFAPGSSYNGATGALSGSPANTTASFKSASGGGTDKTATVVSQADIDKAKQQLAQQDTAAINAELKKKFGSDAIVINESFKAEPAEPVASPGVDQEATKAKLTAETTYTLVGVKRSDLKANFDAYLKKQLAGKEDQKVYSSGDDSVGFSQFSSVEGGFTVKATAQAQVGPQIDENELKSQLAGKRTGEIQQQLEGISGIEDVETSFFPFWVTKAPGKDKITIKFVLKNDTN